MSLLQNLGLAPQPRHNPVLEDLPTQIRFLRAATKWVGVRTVAGSAPPGMSLLSVLMLAFSLEWNLDKKQQQQQQRLDPAGRKKEKVNHLQR